jgi:hypothetical protein
MTNDQMDDLVDEWHFVYQGTDNLTEFLMTRTNLSYVDVVHWIETAELPKEE